MNGVAEKSAQWLYRGIWLVLVECFRVPDKPPTLAVQTRGELRVFHPSRRYLPYLKLYFWLALVIIDGAILIAWLVLYWYHPVLGLALAIPALVIAIVPDILAYIAIHLRYDTIWYAVSDRGVHLRRGIVVIAEHTVSIANIQNVSVCRGAIEQAFGIATLVIETAGASAGEEEPNALMAGNRVIMVGLENVDEIRELLMTKVRACRSAGLGDQFSARRPSRWNATDLGLLVEIRDEVKQLR